MNHSSQRNEFICETERVDFLLFVFFSLTTERLEDTRNALSFFFYPKTHHKEQRNATWKKNIGGHVIIYLFTTCFVVRYIFIMIYLFYYLHKIFK